MIRHAMGRIFSIEEEINSIPQFCKEHGCKVELSEFEKKEGGVCDACHRKAEQDKTVTLRHPDNNTRSM